MRKKSNQIKRQLCRDKFPLHVSVSFYHEDGVGPPRIGSYAIRDTCNVNVEMFNRLGLIRLNSIVPSVVASERYPSCTVLASLSR